MAITQKYILRNRQKYKQLNAILTKKLFVFKYLKIYWMLDVEKLLDALGILIFLFWGDKKH